MPAHLAPLLLVTAGYVTAWSPVGAVLRTAGAAHSRQRVGLTTMGDGAYAALGGLGNEQPPRRQPSVYQLLSEEQIDNVHSVADALFNVIDRNGDEAINKEELGCHLLLARYSEAQIEGLFDLLDVNNDGSVSRVELREAFVRYPPLRSAPAMGSLSKSARSAVHAEADATFTSLDIDGDGRLSLAELMTHFAGVDGPTYSAEAVEKIFRDLDKNGDGEISASEFRGGFVRYRAYRLAFGPRNTAAAADEAP